MTTMIYETEDNPQPSTSSASLEQLQTENQNLHDENCYLRQEVEQVEDKVHQLTHELTQKQTLMRLYHKELEGLDGKKAEKKGSNWKSNLNCLKSKAQILENEKWELTVELEARKADLEDREARLETLHTSYLKQIESLKRNVSRNDDILKEQGERNAALQTEKGLLKEKLDIASKEVAKVRHDLETRDKQMEQFVSREADILHEMQVRQQEIDNLRTLYEDRRDETKLLRGTSLPLNGRSRSWSANEVTERMSIKEELEESLRKEISISRNNSFGRVFEAVKAANRQNSSSGESDFSDPFSPCRENQRGLHLGRSPTFSLGGDSGWGSDDETSPHFHRFSDSRRSKRQQLHCRLQLIKPMEGSETLHQWRKLATPSLDKLFETRDGIVTREEMRNQRCAPIEWNTREQMLSEPEEDDDPEVSSAHDEDKGDPRWINQLVEAEIMQGRFGIVPPRRVYSQESVFSVSEPMRPRSRSLVETVRQSGIGARRHTQAGFGTDQQTVKRKSISDKGLKEPSLLNSDPFLSSCRLRRCSISSPGRLGDVVTGFLNRRGKTCGGMASNESLTSASRSAPSSPITTLRQQLSVDSFTSRLGEFINRAFRSEPELTILCVPVSQAKVTDNTWKLRLPNDCKSESPAKLKIKIGNKNQSDSNHPLEQMRRGPVSVLHTITSMRKSNLLTGGYGAMSDNHNAEPYRESPYRGDIVLDMF